MWLKPEAQTAQPANPMPDASRAAHNNADCTPEARMIPRKGYPLANQPKKTHADKCAVMLDGLNPIHVLSAGEQVEWKEYWSSWIDKNG
jgi:hypothetical protein